jgi:hypothetical protein
MPQSPLLAQDLHRAPPDLCGTVGPHDASARKAHPGDWPHHLRQVRSTTRRTVKHCHLLDDHFASDDGPADQVRTKIKLIKRTMYGKAGFPLLRQRVLHAL